MAAPAKTRKASAPRKAKARAVNAAPEIVDDEPVAREPSLFQPLQAVAEDGDDATDEPKLDHPYGDLPIHVFHPVTGGDPIIFPQISTLPVTAKFMWRIYELNELFQSFEWMKLANVPREVQERVMDLPNADRTRFWTGWFNNVMTPFQVDHMGPPGES